MTRSDSIHLQSWYRDLQERDTSLADGCPTLVLVQEVVMPDKLDTSYPFSSVEVQTAYRDR